MADLGNYVASRRKSLIFHYRSVESSEYLVAWHKKRRLALPNQRQTTLNAVIQGLSDAHIYNGRVESVSRMAKEASVPVATLHRVGAPGSFRLNGLSGAARGQGRQGLPTGRLQLCITAVKTADTSVDEAIRSRDPTDLVALAAILIGITELRRAVPIWECRSVIRRDFLCPACDWRNPRWIVCDGSCTRDLSVTPSPSAGRSGPPSPLVPL